MLKLDVFANDLQRQLVPEELPLRLGGCPHGEGRIGGTLLLPGSVSIVVGAWYSLMSARK